jgi:hypothetical protein
VIAIASGLRPTGIGVSAVLVAVAIGMTSFELELVTYAVAPLGVIAIASGPSPTGIGVPVVLVAVAIGVTLSELPLGT